MAIQTIEEGLALHSLGLLHADEISDVALLFLDEGYDVPDMAALTGSLTIDHPADRRSDFERAVRLAGRGIPSRIGAAKTLRMIYAQRASSGTLSPRDAASQIMEVFRMVEAELPKADRYFGDSFGIATLVGLYYSYDDVPFDDAKAVEEIDRDLRDELVRLATVAEN